MTKHAVSTSEIFCSYLPQLVQGVSPLIASFKIVFKENPAFHSDAASAAAALDLKASLCATVPSEQLGDVAEWGAEMAMAMSVPVLNPTLRDQCITGLLRLALFKHHPVPFLTALETYLKYPLSCTRPYCCRVLLEMIVQEDVVAARPDLIPQLIKWAEACKGADVNILPVELLSEMNSSLKI